MKILIVVALVGMLWLTGCAGTTGFASARQQTLTINVRLEGDLTTATVPTVDGKPTLGSILSITTGEMLYDGTRGDVAKNKASSDSVVNDADTVSLPKKPSAGDVIGK